MHAADQITEAVIGSTFALVVLLRGLWIQICPPGGGPRPARNGIIVGIFVALACTDAALCGWFFHADLTGQPSNIAFDIWRGIGLLMPVVALV